TLFSRNRLPPTDPSMCPSPELFFLIDAASKVGEFCATGAAVFSIELALSDDCAGSQGGLTIPHRKIPATVAMAIMRKHGCRFLWKQLLCANRLIAASAIVRPQRICSD